MTRLYKWTQIVLGVCLLCLAGALVAAQEKTVEIKYGEVLDVEGDVVLVSDAEGVREITIPEGFHFDLDGKSVGVRDLKPGMKFTTFITTTETPHQMITTEVRSAEVLHVVGSIVMVKMQDGEIKKFSPKDMRTKDVILEDRQGNPIELSQLKKGQKLNATIVTKQPPTTLTQKEYQVLLAQPPPPPEPVIAQARPAPKPEPRPVALPATGSRLPLLGLAGSLLLALGAGATLVRRFLLAG